MSLVVTSFGKRNIEAQYENMPKITLFINLALPAKEMLLVDHVYTLAVIVSTRLLHSILANLLVVIGTPKYFRWNLFSVSPVTCRHTL